MTRLAHADEPTRRPDTFTRPPTAQDLDEALRQVAAFRSALQEPESWPHPHQTGTERRCDRRFPLRLSVIYKAGDVMGFGSSSDVSLGGMFVETDTPRSFGERITVKFRAAGLKEPLSAPAVVRWVEPDRGMGVQFGSVRPLVVWALQQELKAFCCS